MGTLSVKQGINANNVRSIPKQWDAQWFRRFVTDQLQNADYRNAIAGGGISITVPNGNTQPGQISFGGAGPVVISAGAASTTTLTVDGADSNYALQVQGSNTVGASYGARILGGSNTSDFAFAVVDHAALTNYLLVRGDGAVAIGANSFSTPGRGLTISAGSGCSGLFVTGVSNFFAGRFTGSLTSGQSFGVQIFAGSTSADQSFVVNNQANTLNYFTIRGDGAFAFHGVTPQAQTTGFGTPTALSLTASFPGTGATLAQCGGMISELITVFKNLGLLGA